MNAGAALHTGSAMSVRQMNAEAVLDDSIDPYDAKPHCTGAAENVLLTGATGFLGAFLLYELVEQTSATIHCLVRADTKAAALARIRSNLEAYMLPVRCAERVTPVIADLTLPHLGLAEDEFDRLADTIDAVYHCAAAVKWTYPYAALRGANVGGTHEILRLACRRRRKPVAFVSTVGVFSSPEYNLTHVLEDEHLDNSGPLYVGYAQSKWVAEKLIRLAGSRGLPVSIYRPNVASHSVSGAFNASDHVCLMIKGCIQLGSAPVRDEKISGAAVDYVSRAIVYLAQQPESSAQTFHLVAPEALEWNGLVSCIDERGYPLRHIAFREWERELQAAIRGRASNALMALSPLFSDSLIDRVRLPLFDCRNTIQHLAGTPIRCPAMDGDLIGRMLGRFVQAGYLT